MNVYKVKKIIKKHLKESFLTEGEDVAFTLNKLKSKQNLVFLLTFEEEFNELPKKIVVKYFKTNNAIKEVNALRKVREQNLLVPKVLFFKEPVLFLEKIEGENLCDFINDNLVGKTNLEDLDSIIQDKIILTMKKLAQWLASLHEKNIVEKRANGEVIVLNKGDARLRDFIVDFSQERLYGVDFEDSYEGHHVDDLAWVSCSLLDTNPGIFESTKFEHKIQLINVFLNEYYKNVNDFAFSFKIFANRLIEYLDIVSKRRKVKTSKFRKEKILDEIFYDI